MAYQIPTSTPDTLTVGVNWLWTVTPGDYPTSEGWTLKLIVFGADPVSNPLSLTATVVVNAFQFAATATQTAQLPIGQATAVITASLNGSTYEVLRKPLTLLFDPASVAPGGTRSHAAKMLSVIEAALEGRLTADIETYSIAGRSVSKIPVRELMALRKRYAYEVAAERTGGQPSTVEVGFAPISDGVGYAYLNGKYPWQAF